MSTPNHEEDAGSPPAYVVTLQTPDGEAAEEMSPRENPYQHPEAENNETNSFDSPTSGEARVSAEDSLSAGSKKIKLPGGYLPIVSLFLFGALLGLLSTILAGVFLYDFASDTVTSSVLGRGRSQINALEARVRPEFRAMDEFIAETHSVIAAEVATNGQITSYADADARLNKTVMATVPSRLVGDHQLAGAGFIACLPPGSTPVTATMIYYVSMYYEPLRDGSRSYAYESMLQDTSGAWNLTTRHAREMIMTPDSVNPAVVLPKIVSNVDFDWSEEEYVEYYVNTEDPDQLGITQRTQLEPWASSFDGFPYWYLETYQYFEIEGSWYGASTYKYILQLAKTLSEVLQESDGSQQEGTELFVYEPIHRSIVGTSYFPEANRSSNCYGSLGDFDEIGTACLYLPPENSSFPLIRDLFASIEDKSTWGVIDGPVADISTRKKLDGTDYFVVAKLLMNRGNERLMVIWIRNSENELRQMRKDVISVVAICCACIFAASLLTMLLAVVGIVLPLDVLSKDMDSLAELETQVFFSEEKLNSGSAFSEIQKLQTRFINMAMALHTFGLYVPRDVVKEVLSDPGKMTLTMERRELAVMFADVAGFTTLSERFDDDQPFFGKIMGTFFRKATKVIHKNGGTIDKFIGDCVMCFWGAPLAVDDPCTRAICAGLELLQVGPEVSKVFASHDVQIGLRVGVHFGVCLVGNSGSEERLNYTALGDPVNTASRMEGGNKPYKSAMMISREVMSDSRRADHMCFRALGSIPIRGKAMAIQGYEVFGFTREPMSIPKKVLEFGLLGGGGETNSQISCHSSHMSLKSSLHHPEKDEATALSAAPVNEAAEIDKLYKQRTEMIGATESVKRLQMKFRMPVKLLQACALNNEAVSIFENETDQQEGMAKAREYFGFCISLLETEIKDQKKLGTERSLVKYGPLCMKRMQNFMENIKEKVTEAEEKGSFISPAAADEDC